MGPVDEHFDREAIVAAGALLTVVALVLCIAGFFLGRYLRVLLP